MSEPRLVTVRWVGQTAPVTDLLIVLVPLVIGSALLPFQITVTVLLLRSVAGRRTAIAWVAGMTAVRLAQGLLFGSIIEASVGSRRRPDGPGEVESTILLIVAIVFYITAIKKIIDVPDEDAPSPRWKSIVESLQPGRAFLLGLAAVGLSAKLWAMTLAALGAIAEAGFDQAASALWYVAFTVGAMAIHYVILGATFLSPDRAERGLDWFSGALVRYDRPVMAGLGIIFGTIFMVIALRGLGVL